MNINENIRARLVRLISVDGKQLGILPVQQALRVAREEGFDLVEVAPDSDPPVCRIMDYGKFKYQASKRDQEARKKGRTFQVKEIKLRPHTGEHDLGFKIKNLRKFLEKKNRVKVSVYFRGRELAHTEMGYELLQKIAEEIQDEGTVDQPPKQEGRNSISMVVVPK
ncbi:MAG: translation initiation factor IF-3 [Deltaproteobacteria bacterium]|nr:MAG: translation initiation factor IF-3 [Deltaproteobacteria bacterium]